MQFATATLVGRLTRDPVKRGADDNPTVALAIAVNRSYRRNGDENYTEETHYFDATIFGGGLARRVLAKCHTGHVVTLTGRLEDHRWTPQDEETERRQVRIIVSELDSPAMYVKTEQPADEKQQVIADLEAELEQAREGAAA
jgi:single stranded DNA-binding protein